MLGINVIVVMLVAWGVYRRIVKGLSDPAPAQTMAAASKQRLEALNAVNDFTAVPRRRVSQRKRGAARTPIPSPSTRVVGTAE